MSKSTWTVLTILLVIIVAAGSFALANLTKPVPAPVEANPYQNLPSQFVSLKTATSTLATLSAKIATDLHRSPEEIAIRSVSSNAILISIPSDSGLPEDCVINLQQATTSCQPLFTSYAYSTFVGNSLVYITANEIAYYQPGFMAAQVLASSTLQAPETYNSGTSTAMVVPVQTHTQNSLTAEVFKKGKQVRKVTVTIPQAAPTQ